MSQIDWDCLVRHKKNIIDGKVVYELWDFEFLKGINDTLTEEEMNTVFSHFRWAETTLLKDAHENLKLLVEDVISLRSKNINEEPIV